MDTTKSCQLCGQTPLVEFAVPGRTDFLLCEQCELYQYGPLPPMECHEDPAYHQGYEEHYTRKLNTARVRVGRIAGMVPDRKIRILDVGCGVGAILDAARERGWDTTGVDVSRRVVSICRDRGFDCQAIDGLELPYPDKSFDVVTAWSVIEHVADAAETLAEWRRVLRDDGVLVMDTNDASCLKARLFGKKYKTIWIPGHTYTFTESNLRAFAERAGLETVHPPFVGRIGNLSFRDQCYAVCYQTQYDVRRALRIQKAFQIYLRPVPEAVAQSAQHAA